MAMNAGGIIAVCVVMIACKGVPVQKNSVGESEELYSGFVDNDTILVRGDGISNENQRGAAAHEKAAFEAARIDSQRRIREICNIASAMGCSIHDEIPNEIMKSLMKSSRVIKQKCKPYEKQVECQIWLEYKYENIRTWCRSRAEAANIACY